MKLILFRPVLLALSSAFFIAAVGAPADAKKRQCQETDVQVPDTRSNGDMLCLEMSEWRRAASNCALNIRPGETLDPLACVCQDGDKVGACGD
ncbi:MAG: hypothetical protein ACK5JM_14640 [Rhodoblastus sp.]